MKLRRLAVLGFAIGMLPLAAPAQEQTLAQQRCVTNLLSGGLGVAKAQSRINTRCLADAGGGRVADLGACLTADEDGLLATARQAATATALARCAEFPPDFGAPAAFEQTVSAAAVVHQRGVVHDLFGDDPGAAIMSSAGAPRGARCQAQVAKRTEALVRFRQRAFARCVKRALKGGADRAETLADCVRGEPRGAVAKGSRRLRRDVMRRCRGVDLATAFPGRCAAAGAECLVARTACRACRLEATWAALDVDCDLVDDGADNGSCRFLVSLSGDAIPFTDGPDGRIGGATIAILERPEQQVVTSADGAFLFADLEEGSEVTLTLSHPDYHPTQTGTIRLGATGASRVTFQAVTQQIYDALALLLNVVPDEENRCQTVTTVTRVGRSIYDPGAHGEGGVTVTITPPLPAEHGPIYFNASVLPDRSLTETSEDGGVLFIQVPPGEYVWTARKPGVLLSRIKMKCRVGMLVNASPPWGLQTH